MTNHGIEINKKKDGFERNGVLDFIEEREKKDGGYDEQWIRICRRKKKTKKQKQKQKIFRPLSESLTGFTIIISSTI